MPQKISKNTFYKGMNLDADITSQPEGTYREANEFRLSVDENSTFGTLTNVKGNTGLGLGLNLNYTILGHGVFDDYIILFVKYEEQLAPSNTYDLIYRISIDNESATTTLLWSDEGKSSEDKLNLNIANEIKIVTRKESEDIHKIYWVDNDNYLRYANVADNLTDDGEPKSGSNDYVSAKFFGTVSSITFTEPELVSSGGGGLNVGMVQYAYQLYNRNGSETSFSPATGLYHLSSSANSGGNTQNYSGNAVGEESGKSYTFEIDLDTYEYDRIRIVSIYYNYFQQSPTINIITERPIGENGIVRFTDSGSGYIGSYTVEQFTAIAGLYKAKDIASSKNYLFLANITENYFDIGNYDSRVYRFRSSDNTAVPYESNGDYYTITSSGSWTKKNSSNVTIGSGSDWSIPEDADLLNYYNDPNNDGPGATWAHFWYQSNGSTLGGTGKNITMSFDTDSAYIDQNSHVYRISTNESANDLLGSDTIGYDGYYSPYYTANKRSYSRKEVYRFGIIFFDEFGRESTVQWICDVKIPDLSNYNGIADRSGNNNYVRIVYPKFTVNNYPENAVSYKIVRVQRTDNDKSIIASGMLRPTSYVSSTGEYQSYHLGSGLTQTLSHNLMEFISPEISFYKEWNVKSGDYIEVHTLNDEVMWNPENETIPSIASQDLIVKYRGVNYFGSLARTDIEAGEVVGLMEEGETTSIDGYTFRGYFNSNSEDAYKGTSLIFSGTNNNWSFSGTYTNDVVQYGQYRRNIFGSQYGGNTYSARSFNEYIGCSDVITIPNSLISTSATASQGDVFLHMMDHVALYYVDGSEDVFLSFIFPVESSINLALRHDDRLTKIYSLGTDNYKEIMEDGNIDQGFSALYLYNTVYSQENTIKKYFPLPEDEEIQEIETYNSRILVSERKFNGEESDSWLTFLTNNFIDVDANYGEVNNIMDYNNNLFFWQSNAFGIVDVDPRSLITDNNLGALTLGTGAVLSRFDYLSTNTGNIDLYGLVRTPKGIYWYDNIRNEIVRYQGNTIERLSKLLGVQSWLNGIDHIGAYLGYDSKYDEVLFSMNKLGVRKTLVFNEGLNVFTGFYDINPTRYIQFDNKLISTNDNFSLYLHDSSTSEYGVYYGGIGGAKQSDVKMPINSDIDIVKVFDNINFTSYIYDESGSNDILIFDDTFTTVRFYNSYQNTDWVTLTPGTNIEKKKGIWSMHVPRNAVNVDPSTNPDIFNSNNLDQNRTFKTRMRDTYIFVDLIYNNSNNYSIKFPFIHTKYRYNYR